MYSTPNLLLLKENDVKSENKVYQEGNHCIKYVYKTCHHFINAKLL